MRVATRRWKTLPTVPAVAVATDVHASVNSAAKPLVFSFSLECASAKRLEGASFRARPRLEPLFIITWPWDVRGLVVDGVGVPIIHALPLTNLICKPRGRYRALVAVSSPKSVASPAATARGGSAPRRFNCDLTDEPPGSRRWRPRCDLRGATSLERDVISRPGLTRLKFLNRSNSCQKWQEDFPSDVSLCDATNASGKPYQDISLFFVLRRFIKIFVGCLISDECTNAWDWRNEALSGTRGI